MPKASEEEEEVTKFYFHLDSSLFLSLSCGRVCFLTNPGSGRLLVTRFGQIQTHHRKDQESDKSHAPWIMG